MLNDCANIRINDTGLSKQMSAVIDLCISMSRCGNKKIYLYVYTSIARRALSSLQYRVATFALQRTFRFTSLGLAFCFFRFSNTVVEYTRILNKRCQPDIFKLR